LLLNGFGRFDRWMRRKGVSDSGFNQWVLLFVGIHGCILVSGHHTLKAQATKRQKRVANAPQRRRSVDACPGIDCPRVSDSTAAPPSGR